MTKFKLEYSNKNNIFTLQINLKTILTPSK